MTSHRIRGRILPGRTGSAVALLLVVWLSSTSPAVADQPEDRTFDAKGVKLHFLVEGQGEPVVLIHGLHASAEINWQKPGIMGVLAKDHQVIALDLPGHGRSEKPDREEAYGLALADDVILLLDHLKIKKAHLVGYSLGGMVAMKVTTDHPERVLSLTLGGMGWLREGSRLQQVWERMPAREGGRTPAECIHSTGKLAVTEDEIEKVKVPTTIIVGDRDPVNRLYVAPLRALRKDWPVVEIEDAGHLNCIVKPKFSEEIVAWIGKNRVKVK
jgi:pimeloyl-ACP methyl ester carboxylesterase